MGSGISLIAAGLLAWTAAGLAEGDNPDPQAVLRRVRAKTIADGDRMPNYTCVETVERKSYHPLAATLPWACSVIVAELEHPTPDLVSQLFSTDRLRLDVTMATRGEIFSWAGASKFDDAGIEHLIRQGPMGTGAFGAYLLTIFEAETQFTFSQTVARTDRKLLEFHYHVPQAASHYKIRNTDGSSFYTGFGGSFLADPETDEVVELVVQTDELPESTGSCVSISNMDFETVPIAQSEARLATHLRQRWIAANGGVAENMTTFTNCREYAGESTVTFLPDGSVPAAGGEKTAVATAAPIPAGLRFGLILAEPIHTATAAAGDPFRATLSDALRGSKHQVIAPKGSVVEGRILRVESFEKPPQVFVVLRPRSVEAKGVKMPLTASLDWQSAMMANRQSGRTKMQIYISSRGEEQSGIFRFAGKSVVIGKGMRSEWRSLAPEVVEGK